MPKSYQIKENENGDFVTANHVRYSVHEISIESVHIPEGRESHGYGPGAFETYDTLDEFLAIYGFERVEDHVFPDPEPEVVPVYVPNEVDFWKIKTVLQVIDNWDNVIAVANTLPDEQKIPILNGLQHAATMTRVHPLVQLMISIPALDITAEQMDEIFVATQQYD